MSALAPTLSRAMQRGTPDVWAAICSSAGFINSPINGAAASTIPGAKWTAASAGLSSPAEDGKQRPMQGMDHCPYCAWHAPTLGLPPAPLQPHLAAVAFEALPLASLHAPRTLFAWTTAQPRAPPLVA